MTRNYKITLGGVLVLLALSFISGCYFEVPQTTAGVQPAADQQALEAEVKEAIFAYEAAYESGNVDQIMSFYADDIISAPPGYPMVQGKEAVEAGYQEMFEAYTLDRDFEILEMDVDQNSASRLMGWTNVWTPREDGEIITEVGHCVIDYEKIDGEWKMVREIWNMEAVTMSQVSAAVPAEEPSTEDQAKFYTSQAAHERLGMIDLASGEGSDIGPYANDEININRTGWPVGNGAIYENDFYIIASKRLLAGSAPAEAESHLGKVDMHTGKVELLGDMIHPNLMALEIDPCGNMYAAGFTLSNQLGEIFGDTNLYHVDRENASLTFIGDTGIERIMDFSFDPDGTLWGTVGNVLYTFDLETAAPTEMATITGVENDDEIMGIAFTDQGELYATTPFSDGFYRLDVESGVATEIGRHGFTVPHGGDIPMSIACEQ